MAIACRGCPWSSPLPETVTELIRVDRLLRVGFSLPLGRLSRWREDALLIVRDEIATLLRAQDG